MAYVDFLGGKNHVQFTKYGSQYIIQFPFLAWYDTANIERSIRKIFPTVH
jgi:hypothetical protein